MKINLPKGSRLAFEIEFVSGVTYRNFNLGNLGFESDYDSSLHPKNNQYSIEIKHKSYEVGAVDIDNVKKLLEEIKIQSNGTATTNDHCGFHIHVSFKNESTRDLFVELAQDKFPYVAIPKANRKEYCSYFSVYGERYTPFNTYQLDNTRVELRFFNSTLKFRGIFHWLARVISVMREADNKAGAAAIL